MKPKTVLITGSSGLIGSEAVEYFDRQGHRVHGIDNNMRRVFFGRVRRHDLESRPAERRTTQNFTHIDLESRDREALDRPLRVAAFRPHHPLRRAALARQGPRIPVLDFEVNARGHRQSSRSHAPALPGSRLYLS